MRSNPINEMEDSPVSGMLQGDSPPPDSVDDQIDALIIRYEQEAVESGEESSEEEKMFESLKNLDLRFLMEQDETEAEAAPATGSETPKKDPEPPADEKPPLDIDLFTKKIARLVMNAHTLLQVEEIIIARAIEFLKKNYDQSYVDQMQDILNNQYDFDLEGQQDVRDYPIAAGAATKSAGG